MHSLHAFNTRDRLAPGNAVIVPKFINRCLWDRSRNDVSQAADIGRPGIYTTDFFAADIGRLGAKGLKGSGLGCPNILIGPFIGNIRT
jgi:hypothetical protein